MNALNKMMIPLTRSVMTMIAAASCTPKYGCYYSTNDAPEMLQDYCELPTVPMMEPEQRTMRTLQQ